MKYWINLFIFNNVVLIFTRENDEKIDVAEPHHNVSNFIISLFCFLFQISRRRIRNCFWHERQTSDKHFFPCFLPQFPFSPFIPPSVIPFFIFHHYSTWLVSYIKRNNGKELIYSPYICYTFIILTLDAIPWSKWLVCGCLIGLQLATPDESSAPFVFNHTYQWSYWSIQGARRPVRQQQCSSNLPSMRWSRFGNWLDRASNYFELLL